MIAGFEQTHDSTVKETIMIDQIFFTVEGKRIVLYSRMLSIF